MAGRAATRYLDGTSMATPHVSGAAALLLAHDGGLTVAGLRAALLSSAHPVAALAGRVATGGRLDVAAALVRAPGAARAAGRVPPRRGRPGRGADARRRRPPIAPRPGVSLRIDRGTLRAVRTRGLRLALGASEACRASIDVRIDARIARRLHLASRTIGRASVRLARPASRRAITVRVSARVARALRCATRLRVVARAVAVDAAGQPPRHRAARR